MDLKGKDSNQIKKYKQYSNENLLNAVDKVQNGSLTLNDAAKVYGVPMTTIRLKSQKLSEDYKKVKKSDSKQNADSIVKAAINLVANGNLTVNQASKQLGIPFHILTLRLKKERKKKTTQENSEIDDKKQSTKVLETIDENDQVNIENPTLIDMIQEKIILYYINYIIRSLR